MGVKLKHTRVAVVGSGIGGLSTVYNVWKQVGHKCQIDLYEPTDKVEYSTHTGYIDALYTTYMYSCICIFYTYV